MLAHLARELAHARILVAGTYRDTDLDRQHPLSGTLAELNREQLFTRVLLRGLTRDEVGEYMRATMQAEPPARLVDRVHEETEGNAFFLGEVVNLMAQEGSFEQASVSDVAIPEGVKEALGRRLDRLSAWANELLSLATVLGREFEHAQLVAVSGKSGDEVLELTEEALAARVLEETGRVGGYRFLHALMQETLLGELSAARPSPDTIASRRCSTATTLNARSCLRCGPLSARTTSRVIAEPVLGGLHDVYDWAA
jgi:predicted ATPase